MHEIVMVRIKGIQEYVVVNIERNMCVNKIWHKRSDARAACTALNHINKIRLTNSKYIPWKIEHIRARGTKLLYVKQQAIIITKKQEIELEILTINSNDVALK